MVRGLLDGVELRSLVGHGDEGIFQSMNGKSIASYIMLVHSPLCGRDELGRFISVCLFCSFA